MARSGRLLSLNVARASAVTIGDRSVMTAIGKRAVDGARAVGPLGIEGDEQADLSVHGGPSKAVYAYPSEHYPFWQTVRAQAGVAPWDEPLVPGALGENLTLAGVVESEVFIGDVLRFPNCAQEWKRSDAASLQSASACSMNSIANTKLSLQSVSKARRT